MGCRREADAEFLGLQAWNDLGADHRFQDHLGIPAHLESRAAAQDAVRRWDFESLIRKQREGGWQLGNLHIESAAACGVGGHWDAEQFHRSRSPCPWLLVERIPDAQEMRARLAPRGGGAQAIGAGLDPFIESQPCDLGIAHNEIDAPPRDLAPLRRRVGGELCGDAQQRDIAWGEHAGFQPRRESNILTCQARCKQEE
jgi:hypothetical protein